MDGVRGGGVLGGYSTEVELSCGIAGGQLSTSTLCSGTICNLAIGSSLVRQGACARECITGVVFGPIRRFLTKSRPMGGLIAGAPLQALVDYIHFGGNGHGREAIDIQSRAGLLYRAGNDRPDAP